MAHALVDRNLTLLGSSHETFKPRWAILILVDQILLRSEILIMINYIYVVFKRSGVDIRLM